ncbi:MAG: hypothetical protein EPN19_09320 [Betaproteobacteria bacterium]|nr:MAG: hypothetical protein EPN19_09320 [Betaproteobacteria bacterium]
MRRLKLIAFALAAGLLGAALAAPAQAHGPRTRAHIGLHFGIPLAWPHWGYPYPYAYPPYPSSVVVVPSEPTVYVERPSAQPAPEASAYWYYCAGAGAYYPYVRECPGGWQRVAPQPPGE